MEKIIAVYHEGSIVGFIETDYSIEETEEKLKRTYKGISVLKRNDLRWHYIAISVSLMDDPKIRTKSVDRVLEIDDEGHVFFQQEE